jgi:predicted ArsR family transcriptional regulator
MAVKPLAKYRKVSYIALAQTMKMLLDGPVTSHEVAELTGIHPVTASEWMRSLRKEGAVHITGWLPDSMDRDVTAVYSIGPGRDKARRKLTPAERTARYRQRQRRMAMDQAILGTAPKELACA